MAGNAGCPWRPVIELSRYRAYGINAPSAARLRLPVKRILCRYGCPPHTQERAMRSALEQAEVMMSAERRRVA
jgi:Domain of unknown function (DUF3387)